MKLKKLSLNLERTLDKRGGGTAISVTTLQVMTKKVVSFFQGKIGVTPSVSAPGDTNPSDATVYDILHRLSGTRYRHKLSILSNLGYKSHLSLSIFDQHTL